MGSHDLASDVETKSKPLTSRAVVINAVKPLEYPRQDLSRDTRAMITNLDLNQVINPAYRDLDRSASACKVDGIADQVEENLLDPPRVGRDQKRFLSNLQLDRLVGGDHLDRVQCGTSKVDDVERRTVELEGGGLEPGDIDNLARQLREPARLLCGAGDVLT